MASSTSPQLFTLDSFKSTKESHIKAECDADIVPPWWKQKPMKRYYHNPTRKHHPKFVANVISYFERKDDLIERYPSHWLCVLGNEIAIFGKTYEGFSFTNFFIII